MRLHTLAAVASIAIAIMGTALAQEPFAKPDPKIAENMARIKNVLSHAIDTKGIQKELPLADFIKAIEAKLPEGANVKITLDEESFGSEFGEIKKTRIKLPSGTGLSVGDILDSAMSKTGKMDYAIRADVVILTTPQRAIVALSHDIRDIVEFLPRLPRDNFVAPAERPRPKPIVGSAGLVKMIAESMNLQPWETIRIVNEAQLIASLSPRRHEEVGELLEALRRLADTAVYMNARLYEVDRTFFAKSVAPLLAKKKGSVEEPFAVRIDAEILKAIGTRKLLFESDDVKIWPGQKAVFLSFKNLYRFRPDRLADKKDERVAGTGFEGFSIAVRPRVSPDRRFLRLQIDQVTNQLIGIAKTKTLDATTGKDVEVESPNVRNSTRSGTVQIPDGDAILMPVDYRPPGKGNEDKVWIVVARPVIWIEAEAAERREGGAKFTPKSVWESELPKEEKPATGKPLPLNDDTKVILQAVISDVLTNPDLTTSRQFYGTESDKTLTLVDGNKLGWPKEFKPDTHGYKLIQPDPFVNKRRVLGIRLDKFDLDQKRAGLLDTPIQICLANEGGSANGAVIGSCLVYYNVKRDGKRWIVEFTGLMAP